MCMLCVIPPNTLPSLEKLENSALNNPHGFGFAIVIPDEKRIHVERTMNPDKSIERFMLMRKKYMSGYAMWHARYVTHGSMTVDNCHPFRVGGDKRTVLAHNGILPIIEPHGDERSDTRIFAEDLLPAVGGVAGLDNEQVLNLVENFSTGSKLAILTVDPRARYQCYLIHEERGNHDGDKVWWSNDTCYLPAYNWYSSKPKDTYESTYFHEGKDLANTIYRAKETCRVCNVTTYGELAYNSDYCPACECCYGCQTQMKECLCYVGSNWGDSKDKQLGICDAGDSTIISNAWNDLDW